MSGSHRGRTSFSEISKKNFETVGNTKRSRHPALRNRRNLREWSSVNGCKRGIYMRYGLKTRIGVRMSSSGHERMRMHLGMSVEQTMCMDEESISAKKHCEKYQ